MKTILFLWGIACTAGGAYFGYRLVNILFFQGCNSTFPTFLTILSLMGILVCITLVYVGYKLLTLKARQ